jgi:hypothetical protein
MAGYHENVSAWKDRTGGGPSGFQVISMPEVRVLLDGLQEGVSS